MLIASSTHLSKWILFWTLFGAFCYDFVPKIAKLTALGCLSKQGAKQNFIAQFFVTFSEQTESSRNLSLNVRGELQETIGQFARWTHDERTPSNQGRVLGFDFVQLFYFSFHFILVTFGTPE